MIITANIDLLSKYKRINHLKYIWFQVYNASIYNTARMKNINYSLLVLFLFLSNPIQATEEFKKFQWIDKVKTPKIIITNNYGDVRLKYGGNENKVEYIGVVQNLDENNPLKIVHLTKDHVFSIEVTVNDKAVKNSRVDITVFIPVGKEVTVITDKGLINATGVKANLNLKSDSGTIKVDKIKGTISTENNTGSTFITLKSNFLVDAEQSFKSIYGNISLWMRKDAHHEVTLSTSADIISDFSMKVKKNRHQEPNKTAKILLNKAVSKLVLFSKRGVIAVREN